jgi:hypothetical protein
MDILILMKLVRKAVVILDKFISELKELMEKHNIQGDVNIREISVSPRASFFDKNENIWESSEYWFEKLNMNKKGWLLNDYSLQTEFKISDVDFVEEVVDEILEYYEDTLQEDEADEIKDGTLQEFLNRFDNHSTETMEKIQEEIDNKDFYELEEHLNALYGVEYPEETFNDIEVLA